MGIFDEEVGLGSKSDPLGALLLPLHNACENGHCHNECTLMFSGPSPSSGGLGDGPYHRSFRRPRLVAEDHVSCGRRVEWGTMLFCGGVGSSHGHTSGLHRCRLF
uniref:(northern house mosquito) hypothetical protein n=1 Tax=Culex pipiens TaxID=7175 RepID=A0A8D8NZI9_CULPI